ncbi:GIY-YIG nuclease family protein [Candidatus Parcubacteria bacterium]|nr:GIY-YIG nuclease family protein [Candidatus Parcubacteria bacterium]
MNKFFYVYVLLSLKDNKFYTGYSKNLKERFDDHCKGLVSATKERRPLILVYYEACLDRTDAMHRELYLKTYHGKCFIKKRIKLYLTGVVS